jgi:hypothetical protein
VTAIFMAEMRELIFPKVACAISPQRMKARLHAPAASVHRTSSLKAFLDRRSALAWRRDEENLEDLKGADSGGSVNEETVFFRAKMEVS